MEGESLPCEKVIMIYYCEFGYPLVAEIIS